MEDVWGDHEKINEARKFANWSVKQIPAIENELGFSLFMLKDDRAKREIFFSAALKMIKMNHCKGSAGYEDVCYIIDEIIDHVFGDDGQYVSRMFYEDDFYENIKEKWNEI